jgi:hypothetical protein
VRTVTFLWQFSPLGSGHYRMHSSHPGRGERLFVMDCVNKHQTA